MISLSGAVVGAFYTVDEDSDHLVRLARFGLAEDAPGDRYAPGEGLVGPMRGFASAGRSHTVPEGYLRVRSGVGMAGTSAGAGAADHGR